MPFDASGNFTRNYNFQQDRDNGIKILAARVDGEFDNVATGMNLVFFRDGRVPMQADLRMNINGIQGLKDGALGSPAIKFNTDPNTGPYLAGLNQYAIAVNAVQRGVFTTTGFDVAGNFTASGTIAEGGTLLSAKYAPIANPTHTGTVTAPTYVVQAAAGSSQVSFQPRDGTTGNSFLYSPTLNQLKLNQNGVDTLSVTSAGVTIVPATTFNANVTAPNFTSSGASGGVVLTPRNATSPSPTVYSPATGQINLYNGSIDILTLTSAAATFNGAVTSPTYNVIGASGAVNFAPRDLSGGSVGVYSAANKSLTINDGAGSDIITFNASGTATLPKSGYIAGGVQGSYNIGYSSSRVGQVGYHMYNGGGVTEWVIYQPAHATGDEFRIGSAAAGTITDRVKITSGGATTVTGTLQSDDHTTLRASAPTTGAVFFGNTGTRSLLWDATNFNLNGSLIVTGNITSTSDIRLKSNVRPLENGMAYVRRLQGKRFTMYGKPDLGFVAQDVECVLPEVISKDSKGYLSVDYGRLTAVLAEAVKSLDDRLSAVERLLVL